MALKDRIETAITNTPPERRGYSLNHLGTSLGDLLTDLAPFIEAEIERLTAELAARAPADAPLMRAALTSICHGERMGLDAAALAQIARDWLDAPAADASLEARAEAHGRAIIAKLGPLGPVPPRYFRAACIDLVRAVDASRPVLTDEQLDVLARAMPDVVDYERATPEQRRATVLEVLAAHGPRPTISAGRPGLTEVPGVVFDVLGKARAFVEPLAEEEPHDEAGHLAETTCRTCHAQAMLAEIEGAEEECRLAEERTSHLTIEQARAWCDEIAGRMAPEARPDIQLQAMYAAEMMRAARGETGPAIDESEPLSVMRANFVRIGQSPDRMFEKMRDPKWREAFNASRGETGPAPTWGERAIAEHRRAADLGPGIDGAPIRVRPTAATDLLALDPEDGTLCADCRTPRNAIHGALCSVRAGAKPGRTPDPRATLHAGDPERFEYDDALHVSGGAAAIGVQTVDTSRGAVTIDLAVETCGDVGPEGSPVAGLRCTERPEHAPMTPHANGSQRWSTQAEVAARARMHRLP